MTSLSGFRAISASRQKGLTLLEVMVAISIMAIIAVVSYQALSVVADSSEASQEKLARLKQIDRTWIVIENDLRHILPQIRQPQIGEQIAPFTIEASAQDYWMTLLRAGVANPLVLPRTEVQRVAYKIEDKVLSRFTWSDTYDIDEENAFPRKLLDGVEEILVRVLTPSARNITSGPWSDIWPERNSNEQSTLPLAVEVTLTLDDTEELIRFIPLVRVPPAAGNPG